MGWPCSSRATATSSTERRAALSQLDLRRVRRRATAPVRAPFVLAPVFLVSLGLALGPAPAAGDESPNDPWDRLAGARESLSTGPLVADFVQVFVPAGFSSGERETGRVRLGLPGCLRWDYSIPYPKSFLVCDETVWTWNEGESTGRRHRIEAGDTETGLDLMRLSVERLRERYEASGDATEDGGAEIVLLPLEPTTKIARASLTLEPETHRPIVITYLDLEGNTTRFEISGYGPAPDDSLLAPPPGIDWLED